MNDRPLGVTILAVLHVIGGVLLLGAQTLLLGNLDRVSQELDAVGIPPILLVLSALFLAGIALASGIGMWMGTRWGWWCAAFYYVYGIGRNCNALLMVSDLAEELEGGSRGPAHYYVKFGGRIIVDLLLLLYFFKPNVVEHFDVSDVHKGKALGKLVAVAAALSALATGVVWLAG